MSKRLLNEEQVSSLIYRMVMESLTAFNRNSFPQEKKENNFKNPNRGHNNLSNGPEDETSDEKKVRNNIEDFLNMPGVNDAAYAYALYDVPNGKGDNNEKKNARHKIEAKKNHDPDSNGNPQFFTPKEAVKLNHLRTSGISNLRENENSKILMNEEQFNDFITEMVNESLKEIFKKKKKEKENDKGGRYWGEEEKKEKPDVNKCGFGSWEKK